MGNILQPQEHVQEDKETNNAIQDQQEQEEEKEEEAVMSTCEICMEPVSPENFFKNNNQCNHPICSECLYRYIMLQIEGKTAKIRCPSWKCKEMVDHMLCRSFISKRLFDQWCDTLCVSILPPVQYRCYCPYEGCEELIINECGAGSVRKVKCPMCKKYLCFKCQIPWHERNSIKCVESHKNALFAKLARRNGWRRCPSCGHWVERVSGCKSIHCRCGTRFCYKCGEQHDHSPCEILKRKQSKGRRILQKIKKWIHYQRM